MFSSPPSPQPYQDCLDAEHSHSARDVKRRVSSRTKWSIILAPVVLVFITLSTRYMSHPALFDLISASSIDHSHDPGRSKWSFHELHPRQAATNTIMSLSVPSSSPSPTSTPTASVIPTIPSTPTLPTPFPQPFDTTLSYNFSTVSCANFFSNMTASLQFRQCRSFSLLLESSSAFLNAQGNTTLLNDLVWGTCNTDLSETQCLSIMNAFASSLRSICATDLTNGNVLVNNALTGLSTFSLMRRLGCAPDPSTNTYCYVNAVFNTSPSDLYFYQLPYGIGLPNNTTPSCSSCLKVMMGLYLAVVKGTDPDTTDNTVRSMLSRTYSTASQLSAITCGSNFVQTTTMVSGDARSLIIPMKLWLATIVAVAIGLCSYLN